MKSDQRQSINFMEFIRAMDILQFHAFCGMLWDEEHSIKRKWELWPGVRGYPGQDEILDSFSNEKYSWVVKARRKGGSEMAGFVGFKECISNKKYEMAIISKKLPDSKYFLKRRLLTQMKAAYELEYEPGKRFPWPKYTDNSDTGKLVWENGSVADALSSDNEEGRGRNTNLWVFDEIRTFSEQNGEELLSVMEPIVNSKPKNKFIGLSSGKFGSWFNKVTKAVMDGKIEGFNFLFLPADTDPSYTMEVREREMKLTEAKALYIQENPLEPEDIFKGREGAVFKSFDAEIGGRHVNEFELDFGLKYCLVYDHGKQHPAVLLLCLYDRYVDHLYIFDEVFCRGEDIPEVAFAIKNKVAYYKENFSAPDPTIKVADSAIFSETGQKTVAAELKSLTGISFKPSKKPGRQYGMDRISSRFFNNRITIHPRCKQTRQQIEELRYKRQPGEAKAEEIIAIEDDAPSCIAYLDEELNPGKKVMPKIEALESVLNRKQRIRELGRRGMSMGADALGGGLPSWLNL